MGKVEGGPGEGTSRERSFSLVEAKAAEADFFLTKLGKAGPDFFAARCFFSAFISSARSVTFALQAAMKHVPGFEPWYSQKQVELAADPVCRFFNDARRLDQHIGLNALSDGKLRRDNAGVLHVLYQLAEADQKEKLPNPPSNDAIAACHVYLDHLLKVILDCCVEFRQPIDPKVWFSKENFDEMGQTIEDAEEEIFGGPNWTAPAPDYARWQLIRNSVWSLDLKRSNCFVDGSSDSQIRDKLNTEQGTSAGPGA